MMIFLLLLFLLVHEGIKPYPYKEPFVYHQVSDKLRLNMDVDLLLKLIQFNAES